MTTSPCTHSQGAQMLLDAIQSEHIPHGLRKLVEHIDAFGYTRTADDKMPRANAWRPYRLAVQDVIFACTVMRHSKERNAIEIDVFLTAEPRYRTANDPAPEGETPRDTVPPGQSPYPYEPLAAARALTLMVLSEAFRCGAALRLRFTEHVERTDDERASGQKRGHVPFAILQLARDCRVAPLPDVESGVLQPAQAVRLYAALTGFPERLRERIDKLVGDGLLTLERACYLVQHGVWTLPELEGLITGCPFPDLILDGEVQPESRHLYNFAQVHARTALLGGVLDRALLARDPQFAGHVPAELPAPKGRSDGAKSMVDSANPGLDVEDDERDLDVRYDPVRGARTYRLGAAELPMPLPAWQPWTERTKDDRWRDVEQGEMLVVLLRPRDESGLLQFLKADIVVAAGAVKAGVRTALVVPLDFDDLKATEQEAFLAQAKASGVLLLVCPETTRTLDGYAREKLSRSRVLPE